MFIEEIIISDGPGYGYGGFPYGGYGGYGGGYGGYGGGYGGYGYGGYGRGIDIDIDIYSGGYW